MHNMGGKGEGSDIYMYSVCQVRNEKCSGGKLRRSVEVFREDMYESY